MIGLGTALVASSCGLLPLAVVFLGLGSGAFMMTIMRLRPILFPLGLLGRLFRGAITQGGRMTPEVLVYWSSW
ncbi:MAG: hypothetical protein V3U27_04900 [Candidatus Tectomicrobia bacterium]